MKEADLNDVIRNLDDLAQAVVRLERKFEVHEQRINWIVDQIGGEVIQELGEYVRAHRIQIRDLNEKLRAISEVEAPKSGWQTALEEELAAVYARFGEDACPRCKGSGIDPEDSYPCVKCQGGGGK